MNRPTFLLNNKQIRAAGVIPFYKNRVLLIKVNGMYEDFGGKSDFQDNCIEDIAIRECKEESNEKIIPNKKLLNYYEINNNAKYVMYFYPLENYICPSKFGRFEKGKDTKRLMEWINIRKLNKKNLHPRIRFIKKRNVTSNLRYIMKITAKERRNW